MVDGWGFGSLKLKGGVLPPEDECEAIEALREAFPSMPLRLDPNGAWTPETSLEVADPPGRGGRVPRGPDPGHRGHGPGRGGHRRAAGDQHVRHRDGAPAARDRAGRRPGRALRPPPLGRAAKLGAARRHHRDVWGMGLSMHSNSHLGVSLAAMVHLAAATPNLTYACDTHYPWKTQDVIADGVLSFVDGSVAVPTGPGLGVELDRDTLGDAARAVPLLRRTPARGHRLHALHPAGLRGQHRPLVSRDRSDLLRLTYISRHLKQWVRMFDVANHLGAVTRAVEDSTHEGTPAKVVVASPHLPHRRRRPLGRRHRPGAHPALVRRRSTGDLRLGGRFQVEGNAGGEITACDAPKHFAITWEFGGGMSLGRRPPRAEDGEGATARRSRHAADVARPASGDSSARARSASAGSSA